MCLTVQRGIEDGIGIIECDPPKYRQTAKISSSNAVIRNWCAVPLLGARRFNPVRCSWVARSDESDFKEWSPNTRCDAEFSSN